MSRRSLALLLVAVLAPVSTAPADDASETPAAPAEVRAAPAEVRAAPAEAPAVLVAGRIGLVDMSRTFKECDAFNGRIESLKFEVAQTSRELQTMKQMHDGLTAARAKAETGEERARLDEDLLKLTQEMEGLRTSTQQSLVRREAVIYRETYEKVREVVAERARARGITLVFRFNSDDVSDRDEPKDLLQKINRDVVFSEPEHDITDAVIEALNAE